MALEDDPGECCYVASEWHLAPCGVAVVLATSH